MKKILIILLIIALFTVRCSRYIESEDLDFQLPGEPPIPISLKIIHLPDGVNLSWQVSDTITNILFRVYYSTDTLETNYRLWETSGTFSSTITGLNLGQLYFFRVASVLPGNIEGGKSTAVSSRVGVISVIINNDDRFTNSRNVNVGFVLPAAAALMQLSEDSLFTGTQWQNYQQSLGFELSSEDGTKHVYAKFRFTDGSESDTLGAITDSIILDTEANIDSVYFEPDDVTLAMDSVITFHLVSSEGEGGAEIFFPGMNGLKLTYDDTGSDTILGRYVYSRSYTIPVNIETVDGVVIGRFTDVAGNRADDVVAATLLNISNPPTPVTLFAAAQSSSSIRLNWSETIDNDFTAYHIYRDTNNTISNSSEAVSVISSGDSVVYIDTGLNDSTWYYFRIYIYDNTGKSAASNIDSAFTPVDLYPDSMGSGRSTGY
jgi:hypothetical protein